MSDETMQPFYCGSQAGDWMDANCNRCRKGAVDENVSCDIEWALVEAYCGDGRVSLPIAQRMGAIEHKGRYCWPCGEWEHKEGT